MKVVRVQYTVKPDFIERNKNNIRAVMSELRALDASDVRYASYQLDDRKTFMHLVHYKSDNADNLPGQLDSFKRFQEQLRQNLEGPPNVETFDLVDSSASVFQPAVRLQERYDTTKEEHDDRPLYVQRQWACMARAARA